MNDPKLPDANEQRPYNFIYIQCKMGPKNPTPFDIRRVTTFRCGWGRAQKGQEGCENALFPRWAIAYTGVPGS